jgi:hypothetical protein
MKTLKFTGNSYEIGRELEQHYHGWHQDLPSNINRRTLSRQLAIYRRHFPSLIDEIRGMADGATGGGSLSEIAIFCPGTRS